MLIAPVDLVYGRDGHVAAVVGKLLMGFPQKAAGSNPAGGTI
jgi:hypothetical protein